MSNNYFVGCFYGDQEELGVLGQANLSLKEARLKLKEIMASGDVGLSHDVSELIICKVVTRKVKVQEVKFVDSIPPHKLPAPHLKASKNVSPPLPGAPEII